LEERSERVGRVSEVLGLVGSWSFFEEWSVGFGGAYRGIFKNWINYNAGDVLVRGNSGFVRGGFWCEPLGPKGAFFLLDVLPDLTRKLLELVFDTDFQVRVS
jgi:hypothetical protein